MLRTGEAVLWKLISTERESKPDKEYGGADREIRLRPIRAMVT